MKNEKTAKFKDSPLGPIPQDWEVKRLGEVGEPVMCKRVLKSQTSDSGEIPFYKIGTFGDKADAYISRSLYEEFKAHYPYPRKGDILVSAAGTIGRTVVFDGNDAYFQDSNIVWIDHDESKVLNIFLYLCYKNMRWQSEDGGIISRLYNANLKAQTIPLPPLPEQRRIAEALGEMDRLIELLDAQIEKKRRIAQGLAHDLLGTGNGEQGTGNGECGMRNEPIRRLPGFKGEWVKKRLGEVGIWLKGQPLSKVVMSAHGEHECIHYGELFTKYGPVIVSPVSRTTCEVTVVSKCGDILFPSSDVTPEGLGRCSAILKDNVILGGDMIILRPVKEVSPEFISYFVNLNKRKIIAKVTGITVRHVTSKALSTLEITIPPTIAEQRAIAEVLAAADAEIAALETKRQKYIRIKDGVMRNLLTGKVRI